jgi:predicted amidohydrolase YtcJ
VKTLYLASRVRTMAFPPDGEWLLIDDRHVERAGIGDPPPADRTVDLPGTTILPGFVDAHVHLSGTGMALSGLDLAGAASREEVLDRVGDRVSAGEVPLLGQGMDETRWPAATLPTREELDALSGDPILLIRADGYVSVTNTAFLLASSIEGMEGIERQDDGSATGRLRGVANARAQLWYFESLPDGRVQDAQLRAAALAASRGVTCVQEMAIPDKRGRRDVEVLLDQQAQLPVDLVTYIADRDIPYVMERSYPRVGGDLFLDGSIGAHTAALSAPYQDGTEPGALAYDSDELAEFLHNAHLAGLQSGLHVIGDAAIEQALQVWERVYGALGSRERRHYRARRHRLEHFEMASPQQIERAAMLGLAISVQPAFDALWGGPGEMYERRLGPERSAGMNPFRTLVERGMEVGAGSDSPVTPLDPMLAVWALEHHHDPSQRMDRIRAIRMCTLGAARLAHLEKKGRLEPGMAADFAAYEDDPFEVPDPREVRPVLTVSRGREVHAR